ncbi:MAG: formylglycine-generating enzyme family protein, partial [Nitrospinales bacterium]
MVYIPSGYFQMGTSSGSTEDEQPMHFIYTDAYYIDKYEVSNAQYQEFIESTGRTKPKFWDDERFNKPDHAVVGISWND